MTRLGSVFFAFVAGGVLSSAFSVYAAPLLLDSPPRLWPLMMISALLLVLGSCLWAYIALLIADFEMAARAIAGAMTAEGREREERRLWGSLSRRFRRGAALAIVLTVAGLSVLPIRLAFVGGSSSSRPPSSPGTTTMAPTTRG